MDARVGLLSERVLSRYEARNLRRELEERLSEASRLAFRVAYGVLRQREDAEDVAQEALARACERYGSLRDKDRFPAWLVRTTWRLALDHCRGRRRRERRELEALHAPTLEDAEAAAAANEFRRRLLTAIDALPEKLRIVLVLAGIEGHGMREIAALLALPEGTVKSRLHLARRRLLEWLR